MTESSAAEPAPASSGPNRRRDLLIGAAVVLPLGLLGLLVYDFATTMVAAVAGVVGLLRNAGLRDPLWIGVVLAALAVALPIVLIGVGIVVRHRYGQRLVGTVDRTIESIPGLGPVYTGLRRSREVLASPSGEAFAGVVRVRMDEGVHALAFRVDSSAYETAVGESERTTGTAESHVDALAEADLATVFLPFAPNPIVGGHLLTVATDRIEPAGLTVPQALGVLVGLGSHDEPTLEPDDPFSSFYLDASDASDAAAADEA